MRDVNKIILRGIVHDPPTTKDSGGARRVGFVMKTVTLEPAEDGSSQERSAFHRICARGAAITAAERLETGSAAYVEGRLQTRKFRNRSGQQMQATGVLADIVQEVEDAEPQRNRSFILGNISQVRRFGRSGASVGVATSSGWPPPPGEVEETEWHSVTAFGSLADRMERELGKGQRVFVVGHVESRKYTARDGSERRSTETIAQTVVGSDGTGEPAARTDSGRADDGFNEKLRRTEPAPRYAPERSSGVEQNDEEDEVPF